MSSLAFVGFSQGFRRVQEEARKTSWQLIFGYSVKDSVKDSVKGRVRLGPHVMRPTLFSQGFHLLGSEGWRARRLWLR